MKFIVFLLKSFILGGHCVYLIVRWRTSEKGMNIWAPFQVLCWIPRDSKTSNPHSNFEVDVNFFDSTDENVKAREVE